MPRKRVTVRSPDAGSSILLVAIGAVTGVALGALLADRIGASSRWQKRRRLVSTDTGAGLALTEAPPAADGVADDYDDDHDDHDAAEGPVERSGAGAGGEASAGAGPLHRGAPPPAPAELEARVLEAFRNDPVLRDRPIDIGAIGTGVIELTGWVHADEEVEHAITIARGVPDVHTVVDRLTVRVEAGGEG